LKLSLKTVYPTIGIDGKRYKKIGIDAERWEKMAAVSENGGFHVMLQWGVWCLDCEFLMVN